MRAPPHTRGSTPDLGWHRACARGSPAHAGIDPASATTRGSRSRLPRTRGDRPLLSVPRLDLLQAPPHTRGSTQRRLVSTLLEVGSPAHAGIDLAGHASQGAVTGLPRTRGDRPFDWAVRHGLALAPPHTRGSTVDPGDHDPALVGSPAHAGIDPRGARSRVTPMRLPRTRGDRPLSPSDWSRRAVAPPHTRGSTPTVIASRADVWGSPAHAGIDPARAARTGCARGLPRTRGDRPSPSDFANSLKQAPPHTRGSTRASGQARRGGEGSPAHAGIDPLGSASCSRGSRLPRTRGDRPRSSVEEAHSYRAPPHTRGSTRPASQGPPRP